MSTALVAELDVETGIEDIMTSTIHPASVTEDVAEFIVDVGKEGSVSVKDDEEELTEDEDEDEDGSDSDDDMPEEDQAKEEDQEEGVAPDIIYLPLTTADIPAILEALESNNVDISTSAIEKLKATSIEQEQFVSENADVLDFPRIIKVATTTSDADLRGNLLEFFNSLPTLPGNVGKLVVPYIADLILLLATCGSLDRYYLLNLFERLTEEEPSSQDIIVECAKSLFNPIANLDANFEFDEDKVVGVLEAFESTLYGIDACRRLFIKASAFDASLNAVSFEKSSKIRIAGQKCLSALMEFVDEVDEHTPNAEDKGKTIGYILTSFVKMATDSDEEVSSTAAGFISADRGTLDAIIHSAVQDSPDVVKALILQLAKKPPGIVGAGCEHALMKLNEDLDTKKIIENGFRQLWVDEDVTTEMKLKVVVGLIDSFLDLRNMALQGGLCEYFVKISLDDIKGMEAMTLFDRLLESEQLAGCVLLETQNAVKHFVGLLGHSSQETRCIAASILSRTFDSYRDSVSHRPEATVALTNPNVYPRIIAALHFEDPKTVNATANLLAEILAGEEGSKSWSYEEDSGLPPPPCLLKDEKVTTELVHYAIGLLKLPETTVGALNLLCQCCWGYQPGFEMIKKAFEAYIPDANVFFFANLYGQYAGRHSGRQRRVVADAAAQAGGFARATVLLEGKYDTIEERRAAVEGYRVLLTADTMDLDVGRKTTKIPGLLVSLLGDRTLESMRTVNYMVRLLSDENNPNVFAEWTDFATLETVQHLLYWINKKPENPERPDADSTGDAEFEMADAEYDRKIKQIAEESESALTSVAEIIQNTIVLLAPYSSQLLGPILHRTDTEDQNTSLLRILNNLATSTIGPTSDGSLSFKSILSKDPLPSISNCHTWILMGSGLATAFYLSGVVERLLKVYDITEEDSRDYHEPLRVLQSLLKQLENKEYITATQKMFFANEKAVARALGFLRDKTNIWDPWQAADELYTFSKDYMEGIAFLVQEDVYPVVLKIFDHKDLGQPKDVAPLLGQLCHLDVEKLTNLLRSQVLGLNPPVDAVEEALAAGKKGKKGKNKKKYKPRIPFGEVLERFVAIVGTTSYARKAALEAGALDLVKRSLIDDDIELRSSGFKILQSFVESDEGYMDSVADFLPQIVQMFKNEENPLAPNFLVLKSFISRDLDKLIKFDGHRALFKCLSDFPTSTEDMCSVIAAVYSIGEVEGGDIFLVDVIKDSLEEKDAFVQESNWGNSHALRRLIDEGVLGARIVIDAGGIEYALKLLRSDDLQCVVKGGALVMTMVCSSHLQLRPKLLELGIVTLIDEGLAKCMTVIKTDFTTDAEGDAAEREMEEHRDRVKECEAWAKHLSQFSKIVNGEKVENFDDTYFL